VVGETIICGKFVKEFFWMGDVSHEAVGGCIPLGKI
jgi:hypothetical protein